MCICVYMHVCLYAFLQLAPRATTVHPCIHGYTHTAYRCLELLQQPPRAQVYVGDSSFPHAASLPREGRLQLDPATGLVCSMQYAYVYVYTNVMAMPWDSSALHAA